MLVEPMAGDSLSENLNPISQIYYGFSTTVCTPASLAQEVGRGLGAQAGQKRLTEVMNEAGYKTCAAGHRNADQHGVGGQGIR